MTVISDYQADEDPERVVTVCTLEYLEAVKANINRVCHHEEQSAPTASATGKPLAADSYIIGTMMMMMVIN